MDAEEALAEAQRRIDEVLAELKVEIEVDRWGDEDIVLRYYPVKGKTWTAEKKFDV